MAAMMKQNRGNPGKPPGAGNSAAPPDMAAMMKNAGQAPGGAGGQAPNMAGRGPMGAGGAGGANAEFKSGSIDDTLSKFCHAMVDGDTNTAAEYISPKAKGVLASLRDGSLSEEKIEEITQILTPLNDLKPGPNQITDTRRNLINAKDQSITFVLKKEKDVYKITELTLPKKR
jgi:hypothetical protein